MSTMSELAYALAKLGSEYTDHEAWSTVVRFCLTRWDIPVACTATYLAMVYATRAKIPEHPYGRAVDRLFAAWNLGLSLFSCWGFWHMARSIAVAWQAEGLFFTVCADSASFMSYGRDRPTILALVLFCLSKIPELGDTVFLILKRKPVRLLQWYHHSTVLLFCWLALATEYTPGIFFAATNYFVHSIMYLYFFLMGFKSTAKIVRPVAPVVTIIQITQMVWGLVVNGIAVGSYMRGGACQIQAVTVYAAIAIYGSYFLLFSKLFLESRRAARKSGQGTVRVLSRRLSRALLEGSDDDAAGQKKLN